MWAGLLAYKVRSQAISMTKSDHKVCCPIESLTLAILAWALETGGNDRHIIACVILQGSRLDSSDRVARLRKDHLEHNVLPSRWIGARDGLERLDCSAIPLAPYLPRPGDTASARCWTEWESAARTRLRCRRRRGLQEDDCAAGLVVNNFEAGAWQRAVSLCNLVGWAS